MPSFGEIITNRSIILYPTNQTGYVTKSESP